MDHGKSEARAGVCRRIHSAFNPSIPEPVSAAILGRGELRTGSGWTCPLFVRIGDHANDIYAAIAPGSPTHGDTDAAGDSKPA